VNAVVGILPRNIPFEGKTSSRRTWHVPLLATEYMSRVDLRPSLAGIAGSNPTGTMDGCFL